MIAPAFDFSRKPAMRNFSPVSNSAQLVSRNPKHLGGTIQDDQLRKIHPASIKTLRAKSTQNHFMEKNKHTPGPWCLGDENDSYTEINLGESETTASVTRLDRYSGNLSVSRGQMLANARLISAAPDLLAALRDTKKIFGPSKQTCENAMADPHATIERRTGAAIIFLHLGVIDAVLAKAEGGHE